MGKNIVLIGMMGCGKSTVGKELQKSFPEFKFVDTDFEIEKETGIKITEIFKHYGESYFRGLELRKIAALCTCENTIIAVGGGAFEYPKNRENLLNNCKVIYLKASCSELFKRIQNETHRPLLKDGLMAEKISSILEKRNQNYEKAPHTIDTDNKSPYNIVEEILMTLKSD